MSILLVAINSTIVEDDFIGGEGADTGCGLYEAVGKTFPSMNELYQYLATYYGLSAEASDYGASDGALITSRLVANHAEAQNGCWLSATEEEYEAWKNGRQKLYSENYHIEIHEI